MEIRLIVVSSTPRPKFSYNEDLINSLNTTYVCPLLIPALTKTNLRNEEAQAFRERHISLKWFN